MSNDPREPTRKRTTISRGNLDNTHDIDELYAKIEECNNKIAELADELKKIEDILEQYSIIHRTIIDLQASGRIGKIILRFLTWILGIGAALATMAVWLSDRNP